MHSHSSEIANHGVLTGTSTTPFLLRITDAYRCYRAFKALQPAHLDDVGLSAGDQRKARYSDFLKSPYGSGTALPNPAKRPIGETN